jgi:transcription elongation factor
MKQFTPLVLAASLALIASAQANVIVSNTVSDQGNVTKVNDWNYNTTGHVVQAYSGDFGTPY